MIMRQENIMTKYSVYQSGRNNAWCGGYSIPKEDLPRWSKYLTFDPNKPYYLTSDINAAYRYHAVCLLLHINQSYEVREFDEV